MTQNPAIAELDTLLAAAIDGRLTESDRLRLSHLLAEDAELQDYYVEHAVLHAMLYWEHSPPLGCTPSQEAESNSDNWQSPLSESPLSAPQIILDAPYPAQSSPFTLNSPIGSFLFSHVAAVVILGIGLLIGLAWRISLPSSGQQEQGTTGYASAVAHITALANCEWSKQVSEVRGPGSGISEIQIPKSPNPKIPVLLGDRLVLSSGLMQITYDTGAVVLLQGPCIYEIDSDRTGYLAVGKLTAKVEKGSGVRGQGSGKANHAPFSPLPSPLFAVRTPTAVVTDLGTEFGVEVEQSGTTRSHVFQGSVSIVPSPNGRGVGGEGKNSRRLTTSGASPLILRDGESARVKRSRNSQVAITREPGQPSRFVRRIPSPFIPNPSSLGNHPQSPVLDPLFHLTDLGTLGGKTSQPWDINDAGQIVGESENASGVMQAFLYTNGRMKALGSARHGGSYASGINRHEQILVNSGTSEDCRAFLYTKGKMQDLGMLGETGACANAINDAGQVVGTSADSNGMSRAFLYSPGKGMKNLGALGGLRANSWASGINAAGQVVGYSEIMNGFRHAFLYSRNKGMEDFGAPTGWQSWGFEVNERGWAVGFSVANNGVKYAVVYGDGLVKKVLDPRSSAADINNHNQIVGTADRIDGTEVRSYAFLYSGGRMIDLNSLVNPPAKWTLKVAVGINDSRQIIGFGRAPDGTTRAFLLTPTNMD